MAQDYNEKSGRRIVIGQTTSCFDLSCNGWLVDSFSGKYFIKCEDPKHENSRGRVEEGKAASRSTTSTSNEPEQSLLRQGRQEVEPDR